MGTLVSAFGLALASLFPIMNPFATLPVFGALTGDMQPADRKRTARRTAVAVLIIVVVSTLAGRYLLEALGVTLPALQIAGGIVVGGSGLTMISGNSARMSPAETKDSGRRSDPSVVPLAIPMIAGPGAIGVVVALAGRYADPLPIAGIVAACIVMSALVFVVLRFGDPLLERLGTTGIGVVTRIFGLVILAIAVELVTKGALSVFPGLKG